METTFATRVLQFRKSKGLSQAAFAEQCGLEQGNVTQMERGTEPKQSNVAKILSGFPDMNPDWLLLGAGSMLRDGRTLTPLPSPPTDPQPPSVVAMQASTSELDATNMTARYIRALEEEVAWLRESLGKPWGSQQAAERQPYMQVA